MNAPSNIVTRHAGVLALLLVAGCGSAERQSTPETAPMSEGFVETADGTKLYYRKVGDGKQNVILPADLFLHPAFDQLAKGRTLYYYDMRNRGQSDSITADRANSIQQDVADLEALRAHFALDSVDLVGFSYLGLMVAMYTMEHPEHVRRVVQLGPVAIRFGTEYPEGLNALDYYAPMDSAGLAALRQMQADGLPYRDPAAYCEREQAVTRVALVGDPSHVTRLNQNICSMPNEWPTHLSTHFGRQFTSIQNLRLDKAEVARIAQPVLTIHGTWDRNAAYGGGREWAMTIPNARLVTVEHAAHCSWADDPDLVFGAIETFLNGAWPAEAEKVTTLERTVAG
jgi:pimeloyl-ACP methyl ester carboxylesterase